MAQSGLLRNSSTSRNELFAKIHRHEQLKPCCVEISKLAMRHQVDQVDQSSGSAQLLQLTSQLHGILSGQARYDASALDAKIAEYVFFPLSFIFKNKERYTALVLENAIKCLRVLIQHGWRASLSTNLAQQLLILLTYIIAGVPGQESQGPPAPEETVLECYRTLAILIGAAGLSPAVSEFLVDTSGLPSLGHAVTVILEGVTEGSTPDIQLAALDALQALYTSLKDRAALASFLPGTVSALSKLLSPPLSIKAQKRVLVRGLRVLKHVLGTLLGDIHNRSILKELKGTEINIEGGKDEASKVLSAPWLKATAAQIKLALATILKLRNHEADDVLLAVEGFCLAILDECHTSLVDCSLFLVESAIITWNEDGDYSSSGGVSPSSLRNKGLQDMLKGTEGTVASKNSSLEIRTTLQDLGFIYPELQDTVKAVVYNWITSLPRVMQASDETLKQRSIRSLSKGYRIVRAMQIDSSTLQDALSAAMRDSIVALSSNTNQHKAMNEVGVEEEAWGSTALVKSSAQLQTFKPVMLPQGSQKATREAVLELVANIGSPSQQTQLAAEMLGYVRDAEGLDQVSSYWLAFELVKAALEKSKSSELDTFVDLSVATTDGASASDEPEAVFQELYSYSVSVLASHSDSAEVDWRTEAIALEITSFAASRLQQSFRPELIDVLYPTATFLGSQSPYLRGHAITTLNALAASCGYGSVSELIISNVDYMVNSVSLRLNTFDITPASTKVLKMMIRLTGPRLIPFLDDVVAALFAALDNYHGYPAFVESLFGVLAEVVEQGVKSDVLLLEGAEAKALDHRKRTPRATSISDIETDLLEKKAQKRKRDQTEKDMEEVARGHPKTPWKSEAAELLRKKQKEMDGDEAEEEDGEGARPDDEKHEVDRPKPPPTPTYALLSRVATMTQHHLTSPAPTLRKSLLDLLATVSPAVSPDEDAFLPMVNSLWPVVLSRLRDPEPYVVVAACGAVAAMARSAGDFLASRVQTEWWDWLGGWCRRAKADARGAAAAAGPKGKGKAAGWSTGKSAGGRGGVTVLGHVVRDEIVLPHRGALGASSGTPARQESPGAATGGLGRFAQAAQVWEAAVGMLTALVGHVRVEDEVLDQVLDLLGDELGRRAEAREALEAVNADAVWLATYERGGPGGGGGGGGGEVESPTPRSSPLRVPFMDGVRFASLV